jgi:hypothetical protein
VILSVLTGILFQALGYDLTEQTGRIVDGRGLRRLKRGPAAIVLSAAGPFLASVVEEAHTHVFPNCMGTVQTNRVSGLDLDDTVTTAARHPEHVTRDLRQTPLLDRDGTRPRDGVGVFQDGTPILGGHLCVRGIGSAAAFRTASRASFSICFGVGMRQPAGRSLMKENRT